jgi:leucyl aminopeptidase
LTKGYKFSRKEKPEKGIEIGIDDVLDRDYILELANSKIQAAEWAGSRGNEKNTAQLLE